MDKRHHQWGRERGQDGKRVADAHKNPQIPHETPASGGDRRSVGEESGASGERKEPQRTVRVDAQGVNRVVTSILKPQIRRDNENKDNNSPHRNAQNRPVSPPQRHDAEFWKAQLRAEGWAPGLPPPRKGGSLGGGMRGPALSSPPVPLPSSSSVRAGTLSRASAGRQAGEEVPVRQVRIKSAARAAQERAPTPLARGGFGGGIFGRRVGGDKFASNGPPVATSVYPPHQSASSSPDEVLTISEDPAASNGPPMATSVYPPHQSASSSPDEVLTISEDPAASNGPPVATSVYPPHQSVSSSPDEVLTISEGPAASNGPPVATSVYPPRQSVSSTPDEVLTISEDPAASNSPPVATSVYPPPQSVSSNSDEVLTISEDPESETESEKGREGGKEPAEKEFEKALFHFGRDSADDVRGARAQSESSATAADATVTEIERESQSERETATYVLDSFDSAARDQNLRPPTSGDRN
uniref:Uncharacterized protein n=1 Tax=Chromera velia CCMP2878 TaxID=1169474 RepID=A0A0G4IFM7_9ALVE|eukprot:Cvel_2497.t1-p1 / transcript=Cvel_2497.t1 / gene=Cvel_2497 / organism=Chromera_velia_CCMP2878 / gene_product=Mucin-2, putative / transcript_product=Mucin-2, putative / location=Cvel_scaffold98:47689-52400(-) / protein_length=470 / sequence_SO=supercontig / SO=protein_coding / is_pseudo=false